MTRLQRRELPCGASPGERSFETPSQRLRQGAGMHAHRSDPGILLSPEQTSWTRHRLSGMRWAAYSSGKIEESSEKDEGAAIFFECRFVCPQIAGLAMSVYMGVCLFSDGTAE